MTSTNITLSSTLFFIQQQVTRYLYSVYLIFGITGCCLNIILLTQRQYRTVSCCTYFIVASVTMLINLSFGVGTTMYAINYADPTLNSGIFCKLRIYILQSSSMMYRWCLTMACFDRFALSSVQQRLRNFADIRIACRTIFVIIIVWFILPVHLLIYYDAFGNICSIHNNITMSLYHSLFTTICGSVLPVSIMITCALLIYRNLVLKQRRRQPNHRQILEGGNNEQYVQRKRDRQVLFMLLVQICVYVILITPLMGIYFYNAVSLNVRNKSVERVAVERFALFIAEAVIYLFPTLSFYLYTIASYSFRNELLRMVQLMATCGWYGRNRHINPVTNNTTRHAFDRNQSVELAIPKPCVPIPS
ncbi:hypothetical protein I4U23_015104 [Adineta vaga]|nr:hypothetical protein I4U23_015104 [Adineta vaga]